MRFSVLLLALFLFACGDITPSIGSNGSGGASASSTGTGGATAAQACPGFKDVEGTCQDITCFSGPACTNDSAAIVCTASNDGPGRCFAGSCVWENQSSACSMNADCPCGLCGSDGHCYEDRVGSCGSCGKSTGAAGAAAANVPCSSCLSACQGTGPSCCAGCGCACEGQCGLCH